MESGFQSSLEDLGGWVRQSDQGIDFHSLVAYKEKRCSHGGHEFCSSDLVQAASRVLNQLYQFDIKFGEGIEEFEEKVRPDLVKLEVTAK